MSHISTWKHKITDFDIIQKVCAAFGYNYEINLKEGIEVNMFGSQKQKGVAYFELPKWRYPIVISEDGKILYDNFGAESDSMDQFGDSLQVYNESAIMAKVDFSEFDNIETFTNEDGTKEIIMSIY